MRRFDYHEERENYSTALPLAVIGGAILVILSYLIVMGDLLDPKKATAKVYVPVVANVPTEPLGSTGRTGRVISPRVQITNLADAPR